MGFNSFRLNVLFRVIIITATVLIIIYLGYIKAKYFAAGLLCLAFVYALFNLFHYVENTNRKLTRFLEHIKYSDFTSGFTADSNLGKSFEKLNESFNEVLEAFRKARSEKEEHLQYLNTVVKHVETGLISFDQNGNVELVNTAAHRLLKVSQIQSLFDLDTRLPELRDTLEKLEIGEKTLIRNPINEELAVQATEIRLKGKTYKLVSIHNIQAELQKKELEAWQNLTKVLRHEIMNSITPISSLTSTLKDIVEEELSMEDEPVHPETLEDIKEALVTIESRSHALVRFVNAYKDFTQVPKPKFDLVSVKDLIYQVYNLMKAEVVNRNVDVSFNIKNEKLKITADDELIEMVLINLLKNAIQAVEKQDDAKVKLVSDTDENNHVIIKVIDNGPGIIPEALERIFIPFYTTKKEGSGIGLAWSRQILQKHKGSLTVQSEPHVETAFILTFF